VLPETDVSSIALDLFKSSIAGSRTGLHGQSIQEIFQSLLSSQLSGAMRSEAGFPQSDAHGLSFAAYFPAPGIQPAACTGNRNVERAAG
jgi:hypothetical protein